MKYGIIGGSGLDDPRLIQDYQELEVDTPFGRPSSKFTVGKIGGQDVVILARHGKEHSIMPSKVPYRANIWALKEQGCTHILATTACGSLKEDIKPGDFVFPDQFIDWTKCRPTTFFEDTDFTQASSGMKVVHTPMAEPFNAVLRDKLIAAAEKFDLKHHKKGTIITIEGPRFSTKAESHLFRSFGADVINMSTVPEVILANELNIPYQAIAMATDYDCWRAEEEAVTWEKIVKRMRENADKVKQLIIQIIQI
ncbi:S-methyl-5'-thioadenosine phosphorylase [Candidatus Falkowbacteria bacterium]|nr:S-methyl-5'-thioadenosine phosphorylase [Candidatus Falkowbacteria bacterium]